MVSASSSSFFLASATSALVGRTATMSALRPAPITMSLASSLSTTTVCGVPTRSSELAVDAAPRRVAHMIANVSAETPSGTSEAMMSPSLLMMADATAPQLCLSDLKAGFSSVSFPPYRFGLENAVLVPFAYALDLLAVEPPVRVGLEDLSDDAPEPVTGRNVRLGRLDRAFGHCSGLLEDDVVDPTSGPEEVGANLEVLLRLLQGDL